MYLSAILLYLIALVAVGWRRRAETGDDFFVAGRTLPARVLMFTLLAAWIGSGSLFAGAGRGYRAGLAALWQPAGGWAAIVLVYFIAARVRRLEGCTVPDMLDRYYGPAARALGAVITIAAYVTLAAYQFRAGGRLLALVANVNPVAGIFITALFCTACTALGGMRSISALDVVNSSTIAVGLLLSVVYLLGHAGGVAASFGALRPEQLTLFGPMSPFGAIGLFLPTLILLLGEPGVYQKLFSASGEPAARRAVAGWLAATIGIEILLVFVGVFGSLALPGLTAAQSEGIVVQVALGPLPAPLGVLLLAAAAAIVVSAGNTFLLVASTNVMRDVYLRFVYAPYLGIQLGMRTVVIVIGALAFLAASGFPTMLAAGLWTYTMYGAGITPALIAALVWPRATRRAGVASIAIGIVVTLVWEVVALIHGAYPVGLPTIYVAVASSIATLVAISLATEAHGSGTT